MLEVSDMRSHHISFILIKMFTMIVMNISYPHKDGHYDDDEGDVEDADPPTPHQTWEACQGSNA